MQETTNEKPDRSAADTMQCGHHPAASCQNFSWGIAAWVIALEVGGRGGMGASGLLLGKQRRIIQTASAQAVSDLPEKGLEIVDAGTSPSVRLVFQLN